MEGRSPGEFTWILLKRLQECVRTPTFQMCSSVDSSPELPDLWNRLNFPAVQTVDYETLVEGNDGIGFNWEPVLNAGEGLVEDEEVPEAKAFAQRGYLLRELY